MSLYHKDVYMTTDLVIQCPSLYNGKLKKSKHFLEKTKEYGKKYNFDKNIFDKIVSRIKTEKPIPFEIETNGSKEVVKCCIRMPFDDHKDICIVFRKDLIVTYWFNDNNDNHYTLDESKYIKA